MKRNLFAFLFIAIIALSYVLYKLLSFKSGLGKDPNGIQLITYSREQHFHPDSVLELNWVAYDQVFYFSRANRLGDWKNNIAEIINPRQIQDRLIFLSSSNYYPIDKIKDAIITARIKFDNHQVWELESNAKLLRWTSGPLSGKGGRLSPDAQNLFLTGRHTFNDLKVSWCPERPKEFILKNIKLIQREGRWLKITKKEQLHTELSDTTLIEKWIGKNCYIKASRVYDKNLVSLKEPKSIKIKFQKNIKQVLWDKEGLIKIDGDSEYLIKSHEMRVNLEELEGKLK